MIKRATLGSEANIGETIRQRRESLGLSIKEVSNRTGISSAAISRWETGQRIPSVKKYNELMTALGAELFVLEK